MSLVELSSTATRNNHRRGLKTLLQLPFFPRQPGLAVNPISTNAAPGAAISLPEDVLREITGELSPSDILNVSLTVCDPSCEVGMESKQDGLCRL
jgi:hypothetical protein